MDYPPALANGWPIATGVIEGACRHLVQDRMGITGARWGLAGAEAILWLRAIRANGDLPHYWDWHIEQEHQRNHLSRYQPDLDTCRMSAQLEKSRTHVAWRLSLYGLRRGEVLGLRWSDIDLRARTLTVNQARVLVEYRVRIEEPKSRNGKRTLPLDGELVTALTALRKRQLDESTAAGTAYRSGLARLDWYQGGEYVITDQAGTPVHPEWYSDEFGRLLRRAGLRRITLHDSRHTTLTLMEHAGVPISIVSKWAGHYDSAFTQKTYVHASDEDLQRGQAALAKIHKIA